MTKTRPDQALSPGALRVTSAANPIVKTLKSLHARKGRAETGLFLAEGARLVAEAGALGAWPSLVAYAPEALGRPAVRALLDDLAGAGARLIETTPALLAAITRRDNPQTLVAAYPQRLATLDALDPAASRIWIALEGVRDPGNLGTILRTADSVGAGGVALIGQTCDPFSVEAVRATMGSIFALPLVRAELDALQAWRRAGGLALWGAHLAGSVRHDAPNPGPGGALILMGNEQSGLPPAMAAACDALVRIPMRGRADSLNLAAAAAVLLYDLWRRDDYAGARS